VPSVFAVVSDLFFGDRIEAGLKQLGYQGRVVDLSMEQAPALPAGADLVLVDLEAGAPALEVIRAAKSAGLPVLAFGPHTDLPLREKALAAGATKVVAKSKLTASFPDLLAELLPQSNGH
jgi:DNA-binding response OmpR family regulator